MRHKEDFIKPQEKFEVALIGLGLMGGSLAYALKGFRDCHITGFDRNDSVADLALERGAISRRARSLTEAVHEADLIIFCSSPHSIVENMRTCLPFFKEGAIVSDICGIKEDILAFVAAHFPSHVSYVGIHPMAGKEVSGLSNADPAIFKNAGFLLILPERYSESSTLTIKEMCLHVGAGRIVVNQANEHDNVIAYTSDLMHISATALCASFPGKMTMAHTAGAFRDCTRIAEIDARLWTELLSKNADNIIPYLTDYISNLQDFKEALERDDQAFIHNFLQKACANKRKMKFL